jgi:beta-mannosidase
MPGADRKVKGTIHWVSATENTPIEARLYDVLILDDENAEETAAAAEEDAEDGEESAPAGADFLKQVNPESLVIRKATHMFGWDICPRIVSAGLWRPVSVVHKAAERIEDAFIWLDHINKDGSASCGASIDIDIGRKLTSIKSRLKMRLTITHARYRVSQSAGKTHKWSYAKVFQP